MYSTVGCVGRLGKEKFIVKPSGELVMPDDFARSKVILMCCSMRLLLIVLFLLDNDLGDFLRRNINTAEDMVHKNIQ